MSEPRGAIRIVQVLLTSLEFLWSPRCATTASHAFNETAHPRPEAPPRGRARVLLVEDNPDAAHSFRCGGGEVVGGFFAR